jgi:hypothetical protein
MVWHDVKTNDDVLELMETFGHFHDSCIKELHYQSGTFVNRDLTMTMINQPVLTILFQRMWENPSVVEMEFSEIIEFHLKPVEKQYTTDIPGAKLYLDDEIFYWADWDNWDKNSEYKNTATWVSAKAVKWCTREEFIGGDIFYKKR